MPHIDVCVHLGYGGEGEYSGDMCAAPPPPPNSFLVEMAYMYIWAVGMRYMLSCCVTVANSLFSDLSGCGESIVERPLSPKAAEVEEGGSARSGPCTSWKVHRSLRSAIQRSLPTT